MNVEKLREAAGQLLSAACIRDLALPMSAYDRMLADFARGILAATEPDDGRDDIISVPGVGTFTAGEIYGDDEPVRVVGVTEQRILDALAQDGAFNVTVHDAQGEERINATVEHFAAVLAARINSAAGEG